MFSEEIVLAPMALGWARFNESWRSADLELEFDDDDEPRVDSVEDADSWTLHSIQSLNFVLTFAACYWSMLWPILPLTMLSGPRTLLQMCAYYFSTHIY